ncbi:MAG: calcium/sodium antiporter [Hyphomicrobiaceae bacterium]|nr:calcium/sodium antiporter [Hyphomicrobiaceae bacterium]
MSPIVALMVGFGLLVLGGELLVRGAVRAAECFGISALVIGIVLVGFGTSVPEMIISIYAAIQGSPGIAIGNIVGSSIANILFILGLSAVFRPLAVTSKSLSRDGIVLMSSAIIFSIISLTYSLNRFVGFALLMWLLGYIVYAWRQESTVTECDENTGNQIQSKTFQHHTSILWINRLQTLIYSNFSAILALLLSVIGLCTLIIGGKFLVDGVVEIARAYKVKEEIIGLTVVAVGTSMPELVTSIVASLRKQPAVAVGNILGSNIYNVLGVGGVLGLAVPTIVPEHIAYQDNFIMIASCLALLIFARSGLRITRLEGAILFAAYIIYVYSLLPR